MTYIKILNKVFTRKKLFDDTRKIGQYTRDTTVPMKKYLLLRNTDTVECNKNSIQKKNDEKSKKQ